MTEAKGHCNDEFVHLKEILNDFLRTGEEEGASIAVNIDGENVVDLWGGCTADKQPWQENTIVTVFSCTKTVTALAALMLADRGLLDLNANVSEYWPEFAANGKENVKVRHLLSHTSGLSGWEESMTFEDVCDVPNAAAKLARQRPWWTPGSASGYHSMTMGHLVGELVYRVTGLRLGEFITEEIAGPLDADFQLGLAQQDRGRATDIIPPPPPPSPQENTGPSPPDENSIAFKTASNPAFTAAMANKEAWKKAQLGSSTGFGNARSLTRILSTVSLGGQVSDIRLLSSKTIDLIFIEQANGPDLAVGIPLRIGIGYGLTGKGQFVEWLPAGRVCYWGGYGGSIVIMDLDRRLTISYAMNRLENVGLGTARTQAYVRAVYAALGVN